MTQTNGHDNSRPDLGSCCCCERPDGVHNVIMLEIQSPTPGQGWHCPICGLPPNGCIAVVCDECFQAQRNLRWVCTGHPLTDGRTRWDKIEPVAFHHDMSKHQQPDAIPVNPPRTLMLADAYYAALDGATQQFATTTNRAVTPEEMSAALGAVLSRVANRMNLADRADWVALWVKTIREAAGIHLQ
jgi:hypothetical protein